ncbi:MAG: hypothetical protein U0R19_39425 [Bryobacteraceae bacterium]
MKKNLVKMAAVAAVVMFAQAAGAQTFPGRMMAKVPFTFQAGDATLAPGSYELTMSSSNSGRTSLNITDRSTLRMIAVSIPQPFKQEVRSGEPGIIFSCVGENCMLHAVRVLNTQYGTGLKNKLSAAERERLYTIRLTPTQGRSAE